MIYYIGFEYRVFIAFKSCNILAISCFMILNLRFRVFKEYFQSIYIISLCIRYGSHNTKYHCFPPYIVLWESYRWFLYLCLKYIILVISILLRQVHISYTRLFFKIEYFELYRIYAIFGKSIKKYFIHCLNNNQS